MVDSELNVVPAMADNFRVSSDGLTYLFRIREGRAAGATASRSPPTTTRSPGARCAS